MVHTVQYALSGQDLRRMFAGLAGLMEERKDELTALDAAIGDGDLGLTMPRGFRAVAEALETFPDTAPGAVLTKAGMVMSQAAPSTMGTLLATAFLRMGRTVQGLESVMLLDLAAMFDAAVEGMMARGKCQPGEKTIIDSLNPAARALREASLERKSLAEGLAAAVQAAQLGLESTRDMVAQHGKAACFQEKSLGQLDPGATVGLWLVQAFAGAATGGPEPEAGRTDLGSDTEGLTGGGDEPRG